MNPKQTRRGVLTTIAGLFALTRSLAGRAAASISFALTNVFTIQADEVRRPDEYTYDAIDFRDDTGDPLTGVLEFYTDTSGYSNDAAVFEFGDTNPPPVGPRDADTAPTISLPLSINIYDMDTGTSLFMVGLLATLGAGGIALRNYAALIAVAFAVLMLVLAGLFNFGLELFWLTVVASVILLLVGLVVRWQR